MNRSKTWIGVFALLVAVVSPLTADTITLEVNVAPLGTATSSSVLGTGVPEKVIDEIYSNYNYAHTLNGAIEWVRVTLDQARDLSALKIYNRSTAPLNRMDGAIVRVYDSGDNQIGSDYTMTNGATTSIWEVGAFSNVSYVEVSIANQYLNIKEIGAFVQEQRTVPHIANGITATAGSRYGDAQDPMHMVTGTHLDESFTNAGEKTATAVRGTNAGVWHSAINPVLADRWVEFDLGRSTQLDSMLVWNGIQASSTVDDRGFQDVNIEYFDGSVWTLLADVNGATDGTHTISQAIGGGGYDLEVALGGITAEKVRITGLTNYGSAYWGINEVRFYEVPEPATMSLLALGGIAMLKRRRK